MNATLFLMGFPADMMLEIDQEADDRIMDNRKMNSYPQILGRRKHVYPDRSQRSTCPQIPVMKTCIHNWPADHSVN